jgi:hypothetical protein
MEDIATWVAPAATTLAALMTASNLGSRITGYGFIVFTIGSLAWLALGVATGQPSLVWQNIVLTFLNLFGIWRWLGRQARIEEGGQAAQDKSRSTPGEQIFPSSLFGRAALVASDGTTVGKCVDAMVGGRSGKVDYLVVSEGGVAGVGESFRRLDWGDCRVDGDRLSTPLDSAAFGRLPELARDEWPGR